MVGSMVGVGRSSVGCGGHSGWNSSAPADKVAIPAYKLVANMTLRLVESWQKVLTTL